MDLRAVFVATNVPVAITDQCHLQAVITAIFRVAQITRSSAAGYCCP